MVACQAWRAAADHPSLLFPRTLPFLQAASSLRIEPMRFGTGQALEFNAGASIPETSVSVLNGGGQRLLKAPHSSERLVVTLRLWRLPAEGQAAAGGEGAAEEEAGGGRAKKRRKGRRGRTQHDENADPASEGAGGSDCGAGAGSPGIPAGAELLLSVENKTPIKEVYKFERVSDGLQCSGRYALEYVVTPAAPRQPPLRTVVALAVAPGAPCSFSLSGEGKAVAALKELALGERAERARWGGAGCSSWRQSCKKACSYMLISLHANRSSPTPNATSLYLPAPSSASLCLQVRRCRRSRWPLSTSMATQWACRPQPRPPASASRWRRLGRTGRRSPARSWRWLHSRQRWRMA